MNAEDRIERAKTLYERAVFSGDTSVLTNAERDLDAVEADTALARGRILHARFLNERAGAGSSPVEDPAELPLFERAIELYRALGEARGEAEALFWIGCLHQVIRRDNETAANMVGLAYIAAAQDRRADALATLDEAHAIAQAHGADAIVRQIEQARTEI
ncbi:hypothetical protein ACGFNP_14600 [Nonomuraea sp. NPDC049269]|uniref:hypothetical protein n=1 Tax=Nonomuraea sp. NPDC049269 TaxID=3364349 RepID=UPI00372332AC